MVQTLTGELRSHMAQGQKKKKSEPNNNENTTYQLKKNYMGKVKINKVRGSSEAGLVLS